MLWHAVGVAMGGRVVFVEAADAIHLVVDAAGDVLDVLHVAPEVTNATSYTHSYTPPPTSSYIPHTLAVKHTHRQ